MLKYFTTTLPEQKFNAYIYIYILNFCDPSFQNLQVALELLEHYITFYGRQVGITPTVS